MRIHPLKLLLLLDIQPPKTVNTLGHGLFLNIPGRRGEFSQQMEATSDSASTEEDSAPLLVTTHDTKTLSFVETVNGKTTIRCGAKNSKGKKCRFRVKSMGDLCTYHRPKAFPHRNLKLPTEGPVIDYKWVEWGMIKRPAWIDRQLGVVLRQANGMIAKDKPGWIYIYYLRDDESTTYWKIGRTSQATAEARIKDWPGAILRLKAKVPFNNLAERLIHLILEYYRLVRYVYKPTKERTSGKYYLTLQRSNKELIVDDWVKQIKNETKLADFFAPIPKEHVRRIREGKKPKFGNRTKELEWFQCKFSVAEAVVRAVCKALLKWKECGNT